MASTRRISHSMHDIFGDFNDIPLEDSKMGNIRNLKVDRNLTKRAPGHSRFLKRSQTVGEKHLFPKEDAGLASGPSSSWGRAPSSASKLRTSAALRKLAQIESKIMSRKVQMDLSDVESDSKTSDDSLPQGADKMPPRSAAELSSQATHKTAQKQTWEVPVAESSGPRGKVSRFLKKKEPPVEKPSPEAHFGKERTFSIPKEKEPTRKLDSPDSDEEERKALLGSLMESFREKETHTNQNFTCTRDGEKERTQLFSDQISTLPKLLSLPREELSSPKPLRTSHPPTFCSTDGTLRTACSRVCSPQTAIPGGTADSMVPSLSTASAVSKSVSPRTARGRLSSSCVRSEAEPGQEPLSEASDSGLNDFRINILSLDDLTPAVSDNSDLEQTKGGQRKKASHKNPWTWGPPTDSKVSEHLSEPSASSTGPTPEGSTGIMGSLAYSEDFEKSPSLTASEPTTHSGESLDRTLASLSEHSVSLRADHTPPTSVSQKKRAPDVVRIMVKEKAVQTPDPAFTYQWTTGMSTTGPALGGAYVDPAPIASHVVSADAIEALTAYSPAVFALNDMLKQQLSLTQQFLEASRHLHGSLLQSLDRDSFHYHTLEEAKEPPNPSSGLSPEQRLTPRVVTTRVLAAGGPTYIRHHRPARLTMQDALKELKRELKELKEL